MAAPSNLTFPAPIAKPDGRLEELIQYIRHGERSLLAGQSTINLIALPLIAAVTATFAVVTIGRTIGAAAGKYALLGYCIAVILIAEPAVRSVLSAWRALSTQETFLAGITERLLIIFAPVLNVVRDALDKDFGDLPTLQMLRELSVRNLEHYQDGAAPAQYGCLSPITDSVMKGVDGEGQPFIAIRTVCTIDSTGSERESNLTVFFLNDQYKVQLQVASHERLYSPWDSSGEVTREDLEKLESLLRGTLTGYHLV